MGIDCGKAPPELFKQGDVVCFKSGGLFMVFSSYSNNEYARCVWQNPKTGNQECEDFSVFALCKVEELADVRTKAPLSDSRPDTDAVAREKYLLRLKADVPADWVNHSEVFDRGDVVLMKSGGTRMTVVSTEAIGGVQAVHCVWNYRGNHGGMVYAANLLRFPITGENE